MIPFLRLAGLFVIFIGSALSTATPYFLLRDGGFSTFFYVLMMVDVPIGLGILLLLEAKDLNERREKKKQRAPRLDQEFSFKLAWCMWIFTTLVIFCAIFGVAGTKARIFLALFLLVVAWATYYIRVHRDWASQGIKTPLGKVTVGDVLAFIVQCVFQFVVELIFALLTGGRGGSSGGGGSFSGGGASGRW